MDNGVRSEVRIGTVEDEMRGLRAARLAIAVAVVVPMLSLFGASAASASLRAHGAVRITKRVVAKATAPGLPPAKDDNVQVQFDPSVTTDQATLWLDYVIAVREAALADAKTEAQALKHVSTSDQQQLLQTLQQASNALTAITNSAPASPRLSDIVHEAQQILGLQILGVIAPQYQLLSKEDQLLTWTGTLSNKEAAAAAAIAIVQLSTSVSSTESGLSAAIQSIVQAALSELNQSKGALLNANSADLKSAEQVIASAGNVVSNVSAQLKLAEGDLRQLVAALGGS